MESCEDVDWNAGLLVVVVVVDEVVVVVVEAADALGWLTALGCSGSTELSVDDGFVVRGEALPRHSGKVCVNEGSG